jgi:hypothetical protein
MKVIHRVPSSSVIYIVIEISVTGFLENALALMEYGLNEGQKIQNAPETTKTPPLKPRKLKLLISLLIHIICP